MDPPKQSWHYIVHFVSSYLLLPTPSLPHSLKILIYMISEFILHISKSMLNIQIPHTVLIFQKLHIPFYKSINHSNNNTSSYLHHPFHLPSPYIGVCLVLALLTTGSFLSFSTVKCCSLLIYLDTRWQHFFKFDMSMPFLGLNMEHNMFCFSYWDDWIWSTPCTVQGRLYHIEKVNTPVWH